MAEVDISVAVQNAMCDAFVDRIDLNTPPAKLQFYTGAAPAGTADAATGTALITTGGMTMSNPAFGAAGSGIATASAITNGTVGSDGTPGYWRIINGDTTTVVAQGDVSTTAAATGSIQFANTTWLTNGTVSISALTAEVPSTVTWTP